MSSTTTTIATGTVIDGAIKLAMLVLLKPIGTCPHPGPPPEGEGECTT